MTCRAAAHCATAALAALLAGPPALASAAPHSPSACQRLKGRDLAPARFVKLVERRVRDLAGCVLPRGPVRRVASRGTDDDGTDYGYAVNQVVGRIVVLDTTYTNEYTSSSATRVFDLRGGLSYTLAERCAVKAAFACTPDSTRTVSAAFVTGAGRAVALIVDDGSGAGGAGARVVAFSTLGTQRALDSGPVADVPPASLRLTGDVASWTNAGITRSAPLRAG